jgi:large subunit ribosomal protein L22
MERSLRELLKRPKMKNEFIATQKYLIMSPRKVRLVVGLIKKMKPAEALEKLPFVYKRAGLELGKVIKNAMTSAKNQGVSETDLVFKEIQVGEGPRLKRGKAASRGRWHPFKKRMSHIRVVLASVKKEIEVKKIEKVEEKVSEKKVEAKKVEVKKVVKKGKKETK